MSQAGITDRDREWLEVMLSLWRKHLRPPTGREMATLAGVTHYASRNAMHRLRDKGLVEFEDGTDRTVRPVGFKCAFKSDGVYFFWKSPNGG